MSGMVHRPRLEEDLRTASTASARSSNSVAGVATAIEREKPIASGNGISVSVALAEPMLFLQGFEQGDMAERNTTMLRGSLHIRVSKPAKIKTIYLKFRGRAETEWPEGRESIESCLSHADQMQESPLGRLISKMLRV